MLKKKSERENGEKGNGKQSYDVKRQKDKREMGDTQDEAENVLTMSERVSLRDSVAMRENSPVFMAASSPLITGGRDKDNKVRNTQRKKRSEKRNRTKQQTLCQDELAEKLVAGKDVVAGELWGEGLDLAAHDDGDGVAGVVGGGGRGGPDDDEDVVELGLEAGGVEGAGAGVEDEEDDVVAEVALALDLLGGAGGVGEEGGDVEHDLEAAPVGEEAVVAGGVAGDVEAAAEAVPAGEDDLGAEHGEEAGKEGAAVAVGVHVVLDGALVALRVEDAKLVARRLELLLVVEEAELELAELDVAVRERAVAAVRAAERLERVRGRERAPARVERHALQLLARLRAHEREQRRRRARAAVAHREREHDGAVARVRREVVPVVVAKELAPVVLVKVLDVRDEDRPRRRAQALAADLRDVAVREHEPRAARALRAALDQRVLVVRAEQVLELVERPLQALGRQRVRERRRALRAPAPPVAAVRAPGDAPHALLRALRHRAAAETAAGAAGALAGAAAAALGGRDAHDRQDRVAVRLRRLELGGGRLREQRAAREQQARGGRHALRTHARARERLRRALDALGRREGLRGAHGRERLQVRVRARAQRAHRRCQLGEERCGPTVARVRGCGCCCGCGGCGWERDARTREAAHRLDERAQRRRVKLPLVRHERHLVAVRRHAVPHRRRQTRHRVRDRPHCTRLCHSLAQSLTTRE